MRRFTRRSTLWLAATVVCAVFGVAGTALAQSPTEQQLAEARRLFDGLKYEGAIEQLDRLIAGIEPQAAADAAVRSSLATAYELRARSRFGVGDSDGASADFRALLRLAPGYTLTGQVSSRVARVFDEIRKATVGRMVLNLTPVDAELELDGAPFTPVAGQIPMVAGAHTLSGRRAGCRSASQTFTITPNETTEVVLTLERISASLAIVTSPVGVEVVVDGAMRGRTEAGPLPPQWNEVVAKLGVPVTAVSKPLVLDDLAQGTHAVEFQLPCHVKAERRIVIDRPADFRIDPVKLEKAVASIYVDSTVPNVVALLNGEPRGPVPLSLDEVCEGQHVVEMRSPWGRYVQRVTARAGDKISVMGAIKPGVAVIGVTGLPEGYRGADLRMETERLFASARTMALFAPPAERVQQALKAESLSPGWLAFDRRGRALGTTASAITPSARIEIARNLAKSLEVQGVAELTSRPGGERNEFLLSILASDSAEPDVLEFTIDAPASVNAAIARLNAMPVLGQPSAGMVVADVLDVIGAVVVSVGAAGGAAKAGLAPGDVIVKAAEQPVSDGSGFNALVSQRKGGETLAVEVRDRAGALRRAEIGLTMAPRLIAMNDHSLLFNSLVLVLRARLAPAALPPAEESVARLNLAVALMRLGSWGEARAELGKVHLAAGPGVSNGTVQYLLGLCHEALGQTAEAERAWRAAATDAESLLTQEGPAIKELAERKLAGLRR